MNKATLQTYVRANINNVPRSAETITAIIQEQLPKEDIKPNQVNVILLQLHNAGIIRCNGDPNKQTMYDISYFI